MNVPFPQCGSKVCVGDAPPKCDRFTATFMIEMEDQFQRLLKFTDKVQFKIALPGYHPVDGITKEAKRVFV